MTEWQTYRNGNPGTFGISYLVGASTGRSAGFLPKDAVDTGRRAPALVEQVGPPM
jgi:hypothetical protein